MKLLGIMGRRGRGSVVEHLPGMHRVPGSILGLKRTRQLLILWRMLSFVAVWVCKCILVDLALVEGKRCCKKWVEFKLEDGVLSEKTDNI